MKSFVKLGAVGLSGIVFFKLFTTMLIPMLGLLFGLIALTVKVALIAAVVFFLYSLLKKKQEEGQSDVEEEIVQDVEEVEIVDDSDESADDG